MGEVPEFLGGLLPGHNQGGSSHVRPPHLVSAAGAGGGQTPTTLADLGRAGLDPVAAFAAAAGLHRVVGHEQARHALTTIAAGPPPSEPALAETSKAKKKDKGSGKGKGGGAKAPKAKDAAAHGLRDDFNKAMAKKGLGRAATAGGLAARRSAQVGAAVALRAGAMTIPGLGTAITATCWALDPSERSAVNNLIASTFGHGSQAPGLDAPPEPPRTRFLPLTHDGNRDSSIVKMDASMVHTNDAAFNFHPDDVWPNAPHIETTSNFSTVAAKVNALPGKIDALAASVRAAYTAAAADEPHLQRLWAAAKPGVESLESLKDSVLPAIGRQLMTGAVNGNDAYQAFRDVNRVNREEINNSTSGLIPFRTNHIDDSRLRDATTALRDATEAQDRIASALATAADPFIIANRHADLSPPPGPQSPPDAPPPAPLPGVPEPTLPSQTGAAPAAGAGDAQAKDLASLLRSGMPGMGGMPMSGMGMPTMPSMPGMGGMPQVPGLGAMAPKPAEPMLAGKQDPLKKGLDEQLKEKPVDDKVAKKPGEGQLVGQPVGGPTAGSAQPAVNKAGPALGAPGTPGGPPGAANTTEIGGKKWAFDNPKHAALAHNLTGTDGSAHKSLRQAASEAGFRLPPPGQDIGESRPGNDIKPGDVVMGPNNQNAVYLGDQDGKAMVITERGELKPLDEVAKGFTGPHEGIFRLSDDGIPAPEQQTIQQTAAHAAAPQAPPAPPHTDPGVIPTAPRSGPAGGLDPGSVPPGN